MSLFCGKSVSRGISTTPKFARVERVEDELHDMRQSHIMYPDPEHCN